MWNHKMTTAKAAEATPLLTKIEGLLGSVTGVQIIATFVRMRVWPLQACAHPMWAYEGLGNVTRMNPVELSANELATHIRLITCMIRTHVQSSAPSSLMALKGLWKRLVEFVTVFCFFLLCFLIS